MQYAVLQQLASWREQRAIQINRPRRWIMKDEVLIDLARRMPSKPHQLSKIRGLEDKLIQKNGNHFLEMITQAKQTPEDDWPSDAAPNRKLTRQEEAIADLMMCALRILADKHDITPAAIGSRKDLEKIIIDTPDSALLSGWRKKIAGDALIQVFQHQLIPRWDNSGQLQLLSVKHD